MYVFKKYVCKYVFNDGSMVIKFIIIKYVCMYICIYVSMYVCKYGSMVSK